MAGLIVQKLFWAIMLVLWINNTYKSWVQKPTKLLLYILSIMISLIVLSLCCVCLFVFSYKIIYLYDCFFICRTSTIHNNVRIVQNWPTLSWSSNFQLSSIFIKKHITGVVEIHSRQREDGKSWWFRYLSILSKIVLNTIYCSIICTSRQFIYR